jgi:WhiB family transcriptional regulator, redox-sensing transcriptional regulator
MTLACHDAHTGPRACQVTSLRMEAASGRGAVMNGYNKQQEPFPDELATSWMLGARCRDLPSVIFFPSDGVGVAVARHYCAECPVRAECLEFALKQHIDHGVWGGASERERRRIARSRRAQSTRTQ